jgi:tetratricopeptide (TPR) repeat protein
MLDKRSFQELRHRSVQAKHRGDLETAIQLALQAVSEARSLGESNPDLALTLNWLGDLYRRNDQLDLAVATAREGLAVRRRVAPASIALLGNDLMFLSLVLEQRGELREALACIREALPLYQEAYGKDRFGGDHVEVRMIQGAIARLEAQLSRSGDV